MYLHSLVRFVNFNGDPTANAIFVSFNFALFLEQLQRLPDKKLSEGSLREPGSSFGRNDTRNILLLHIMQKQEVHKGLLT